MTGAEDGKRGIIRNFRDLKEYREGGGKKNKLNSTSRPRKGWGEQKKTQRRND